MGVISKGEKGHLFREKGALVKEKWTPLRFEYGQLSEVKGAINKCEKGHLSDLNRGPHQWQTGHLSEVVRGTCNNVERAPVGKKKWALFYLKMATLGYVFKK